MVSGVLTPSPSSPPSEPSSSSSPAKTSASSPPPSSVEASTTPASPEASTSTSSSPSPPSTSTTASAHLLSAWRLRKEPGERQQLGGVYEELLVALETLGLHIVRELHRHVVLSDGAQDLVNLSNLLFVLQVDGGVEVRHVLNRALDDQVLLAGVGKSAQRDDFFWGSGVKEPATSSSAPSTPTTASSEASTSTPSTTSETHGLSLCNNNSLQFLGFIFFSADTRLDGKNESYNKKSQLDRSVDDILVSPLLNVVPLLLRERLRLHLSDPASPGRRQVLEHALAVSAQHPLQTAGHRVGPEEVVVESRVRVNPLAGVESEELVYQVAGVGVLVITNIRYQLAVKINIDPPSHRV